MMFITSNSILCTNLSVRTYLGALFLDFPDGTTFDGESTWDNNTAGGDGGKPHYYNSHVVVGRTSGRCFSIEKLDS